jgi:hypothetical protein
MWMLAAGSSPDDFDFAVQHETVSGAIETINLLGDPLERLRVSPEQLILGRDVLVDEYERMFGSIGEPKRLSLFERLLQLLNRRKLKTD